MRKFRRRMVRRARRAGISMDTRQFNLCEVEWAFNATDGEDGNPGHSCNNPQQIWSQICAPILETRNPTGTANVQKGLVFASARWKYRYSCRTNMDLSAVDSQTTNWVIRVMSALVITPTDSGGAPLVDGVTAALPILFGGSNQVELPQGVSILWRGMDFVSPLITIAGPMGPTGQINVSDRYVPLERFSGRVKLPEGKGIFWVREFLNSDNNTDVTTVIKENLSMTYKLGNLT